MDGMLYYCSLYVLIHFAASGLVLACCLKTDLATLILDNTVHISSVRSLCASIDLSGDRDGQRAAGDSP